MTQGPIQPQWPNADPMPPVQRWPNNGPVPPVPGQWSNYGQYPPHQSFQSALIEAPGKSPKVWHRRGVDPTVQRLRSHLSRGTRATRQQGKQGWATNRHRTGWLSV